ncbi:hypothetical protein CRG98_018417 [Punica granatum]|uniref:Uncharacterized protein n=1 Tax=Punica granatum TaxID=22663 RepID=A0A2I0K0F2_PUNGR|nr:hypothetical protein CRG98_018417 [Punica granatum]
MAALGLFLAWRIRHPNEDAMWLWGMSVVCEIWFSFSWLLDQLPKLCPINRITDLNVLKKKFETPYPNNPTTKSDLPGIDVFVSTADSEKEPPLVTANTILSILAADYPVEKLSCYVSDDGGSLLTFEAMAEAAGFAMGPVQRKRISTGPSALVLPLFQLQALPSSTCYVVYGQDNPWFGWNECVLLSHHSTLRNCGLSMVREHLSVHEPPFGILDEYTNATSVDVEAQLYQLAADMGTTVVTSSQVTSYLQNPPREVGRLVFPAVPVLTGKTGDGKLWFGVV